jgi:hypothetical protein
MEIQGINNWNLLEDSGAVKSEGLRKVKDAILELKDREIKVDMATFSKEGIENRVESREAVYFWKMIMAMDYLAYLC